MFPASKKLIFEIWQSIASQMHCFAHFSASNTFGSICSVSVLGRFLPVHKQANQRHSINITAKLCFNVLHTSACSSTWMLPANSTSRFQSGKRRKANAIHSTIFNLGVDHRTGSVLAVHARRPTRRNCLCFMPQQIEHSVSAVPETPC